MLKIRLTRVGKKHQPSYRMVVTPKENPVQGQYLDLVGTYNPIKAEVKIDQEKVLEWLNKGAQPSERISRLLTQAGLKHKLINVKVYQPRPAKKAEEEKPAKPAATEAPADETDAAAETNDTQEAVPGEEVTEQEESPEEVATPESNTDEDNE